MKATQIVFGLLCCLLLATAILADNFCEDSEADTKIISKNTFNSEKATFLKAWKWFNTRTANADMTSDAELTSIAADLVSWSAANVNIPGASYVITRSTGAIIIDTTQVPPIYPNIENHNTRYEFAKAILCRNEKKEDKSPVVFNHYWVKRINATYRFYGKALQTSLNNEWFVFRINVPF